MFFAVLSACLAAEVPACGPVTLAAQSFDSQGDCLAEAPRIAEGWLAGHPGLVQGGLSCAPLSDLPALPAETVAQGVHVHLGQVAQFEGSPDGWIANLGLKQPRSFILNSLANTSLSLRISALLFPVSLKNILWSA